MAKIKNTDINKLSKLEQQIEELKAQKKKQEEDLAKNIGNHIMSSIDLEELGSAEELYNIIDEVILKFNGEDQETIETSELDKSNDIKESKEDTFEVN